MRFKKERISEMNEKNGKKSPRSFDSWKNLNNVCARCGHRKRLHLWNMSDHPHSDNWTLRRCWAINCNCDKYMESLIGNGGDNK